MNNHNIYDLLTMNIIITSKGDVTLGITGESKDDDTEGKSAFTCNIKHSDWNKIIYEIKNDLDKASYIPRMVPYTNPIVDGTLALLITKTHITVTMMPLTVFDNGVHQCTYIATSESRRKIRKALKQTFISWFNGDYKIVNMRGYNTVDCK